MATLATLTIDLVGKSAKLNAELKKASKNTRSWANKTRQMAGASAKAIAGFGIVAIAALARINAKNAEFIDQQAKTAKALGITTEALSGLQHGANQSGVSSEALNKSLRRMQQGLGQVAQTGTGEARYALEGLGLAIEDIKDLAPEEQFKLISERLKDVENQSEKVYIAQSLFGKSGAELINLMDQGAKGIRDYMVEAEQLGITFSLIDAAKVEMANDAFDRAKKTTKSFGQVLATETAPFIGAISDMFVNNAKEAGGFGVVAQKVLKSVAKGFGFVADMAHGLHAVFKLIKQGLYEIASIWVKNVNWIAQTSKPLLDLMGIDSSGLDRMQSFSDEFSAMTDKAREETENLLLQEMLSERIERWMNGVVEKVELEAQKQVKKGAKTNLNDLVTSDSEEDATSGAEQKATQQLIDAARERYDQIYEEKLIAEERDRELENRRYTRQVEAMDAEFELLRQKNAVTAELEAEYRLAKEQAEQQHNDRIQEIETKKNNALQESYQGLFNHMSNYFDGMEGKHGQYAQAVMSIGGALVDEEKRKALFQIKADTEAAAMSAYRSLSPIPIVGPALGAAAAGAVIAYGAIRASNLMGLSGAREHGGNVVAGQSYLVGERGYEVFTPSVSGKISNHHESKGMVNANKSQAPMQITSANLNVHIDNRSAAQFQVERISATDVRIIAREVAQQTVRSDAPKVISSDLSNPNSRTSAALNRHTTIQRKRNA
jgi:hypothetical protein